MYSSTHDFIEFLIKQEALLFGKFTLKSGRISPYFYNSGQFNTAKALSTLSKFYAAAILKSNINYDMLFGPAYKGIPLVSSIAITLFEQHGLDVPFCFNRKESKTYGEGGTLIGATLKGNVLIVDDVVSAGTTFKESAKLISQHPAKIVGIITAMDREERGETALSAVNEIEKSYQIKAISIVKLHDIIAYLETKQAYSAQLRDILDYQASYGA